MVKKASNKKSDSPFFSTIDLYSVGKWAIWPMQMLGYLPLNYSKGTFKFRLISFTTFCTLGLIALTSWWNLNFLDKQQRYARYNNTKGDTEFFTQALLILATSSTATITRLLGLIQFKRFIIFWHETTNLLHYILSRSSNNYSSISNMFRIVRKDIRSYVLSALIPSAFQLFVVHGIIHWKLAKDVSSHTAIQIENWMGTAFWYAVTFLHFVNTQFLVFFFKIYTIAFKIISQELIQGEYGKIYPPTIFLNELNNWNAGRFGEGKCTSQITSSSLYSIEGKIRKTIDLYREVEEQLKKFCEFFALRLIIELLNTIFALLGYSFFFMLFIGRDYTERALTLVTPIFLYASSLYHLATEAGNLTKEAMGVIRLLQLLPLQGISDELKLKINLFVGSVTANPPLITAGHFFKLGRNTITSIVSSITTFLIVLVQFQETEDGGTDNDLIVPQPFNSGRRHFNRTNWVRRSQTGNKISLT